MGTKNLLKKKPHKKIMHFQYTIFKTPGVPAPLGEVLYLARLITCPLAIDQSKIQC